MQILSIHLKNIKSHCDTKLDFAPGINVLSGPNGVGKSTVFEAIGYALFGVDAQSFVGNVERFISIGAKRGEISVVFQPTDDLCYRVSRSVGTPSKWLLAREVGGVFEVEEHKDIKETEGRLKELLGLSSTRSLAEQFELVIGPFQHEFLGPFVIRQATRRRDKFDEILGIDTWRKTFNETKVLSATIKAGIDSLESAMGPLQEQLADLPAKLEEHKTAAVNLELTATELKKQQQEFEKQIALLAEADKREKALKELEREISTFRERISNGHEMIGKQKLLVTEAETAQRIVEETAPGKAAYEQAETLLAGLREQTGLQRRLEQEVAELQTGVGKLEERLKVEIRTIESVRAGITIEESALVDQYRQLIPDKMEEALAERLPKVRTDLERLRQQRGQLDGRREALAEGSDKLAGGICPFFQEPCLNVAEKPAIDVFTAKLSELEQELLRLDEQVTNLERQERVTQQAADRIKEIAVKRAGLDAQLTALAGRSQANEAKTGTLTQLRQQYEQSQRKLEEKQQQLTVYGHLQVDIDAAEVEKKRYQPARDRYVANRQQAAELAQRREDRKKFEQHLKQLQDDVAARRAVYSAAAKEYNDAEHDAMRRQKDVVWGEVNALGQKIKGLGADVLRLAGEVGKLQQIERDVAAKQDLIRSYRQKDELVKFLRNRVFRHVSGYLSERFREEISQRANRIYRIIAEVDEELAWGDNYQILLRDMVDGELRERADDQLSGGQTMSAVVALRLAMLQTIGARVAFFDEPTSHLDAARRENLAHAFRAIDIGKEEVTEHWYDQLFLISHDVAFTEITDQIIPLT